ncbi:hypothetical protein [Desulfonema magnum]|uniref:Transposase (putative) YhgA-like domain-containing protein n=1 Tax=Desulfonema magnum TaxID=45655 RepID=A0A975BX44_9BACT|nr:hypothetical protein [Desulfonema magnum]QTA93346.1 Uncharacterized protein dnm_094470 [Desulfonema magnum]
MKKKKKASNKFDIRHKETLTLFLKEYFELFFPDLAKIMQFETAIFLDKELIALLAGESEDEKTEEDHYEITDALILLQIHLNGKPEWILIHWEQQSGRETDFEKRMFHYFCGIYFRHEKLIFPIAMFTDPAKWRKPVKDKFSLSLGRYPINEFTYRLIKLKTHKAEDFEKKIGENPLAAAYLPLTDYPKKERPMIKARAVKGIAGIPEGRKRATLYSLIQESIRLNSEEEKQFQEIIRTNPIYQEVKMLQSVREVGIEEGVEIGVEKGRTEALEETAIKMLSSGVLTAEQIALFTGLEISKIKKLAKDIQSEKQSH